MQKKIDEIIELIKKSEVKKALEILNTICQNDIAYKEVYKELIVFQSINNRVLKNERLFGEINDVEKNRLLLSILELIDKVKEIGISNSKNTDNYQIQENDDFTFESALKLNLKKWVYIIRKYHPDYFDYIIESESESISDKGGHALIIELESLVKNSISYGLIIDIQSSLKQEYESIKSISDLRLRLILELIFDFKEGNSSLKWFIKETSNAFKKNKIEERYYLKQIWETLFSNYFNPSNADYSFQILENIINTVFEQAEGKDYSLLYLFFTFLIQKLENQISTIEIIGKHLQKHQNLIINNAKVKAKYLERLGQLIGECKKSSLSKTKRLKKFNPKLSLIKHSELSYNFEVMVFPLDNEEYSSITREIPKGQLTFPFVFKQLNPVNTIKEIISSVNFLEKDKNKKWDLPTIFEWFIFSDTIHQSYPRGENIPNPELANLSYESDNLPRKLRPSSSYPKGKSKFGVFDCCGNIHEVCYFQVAPYYGRDNLKILGGCYDTNWLNSNCQIIRKFVDKKEGLDERRNVGVRLVKFDLSEHNKRKNEQQKFIDNYLSKRTVSRIGNYKIEKKPTGKEG